MPRKHIVIHGRVQGVGFRYFAREQAHRMGVSGWVRNLSDGTVEIEAQADEDPLEGFLTVVSHGPAMATVQDLDIEEMPEEKGHPEFGVRF